MPKKSSYAALAKPSALTVRRREAAFTRSHILRHATQELSTRGFDGARVDSIAARCRLSKNTLYYHFGSKDGLIRAVLEETYREFREGQGEIPELPGDPVKALQNIVRQTFQAFVDRPTIIRLLNEENLHKARHISKSNLRALYDPLLEKLVKVLNDGAKLGVFKSRLDPIFVYLTMSSMAYHFLSNAYTLEIALDRELSSQVAQNRWVSHIVDVIVAYCRGSRS